MTPKRRLPRLTLLGALALPLLVAAAPLKLHVPSPDWRDQVMYFVVTDRFADGNPRNNDQGAGEHGALESRYNGGDLQGLAARLDYIQGLGATALWITPPVANQWTNPAGNYTGYHGYWAENFIKVDRHLGTLDDYRQLSHQLHSKGMFLVQDIVVNHTGDYFSYRGGWDPVDPARHFVPQRDTRPVPAPSQKPFDRNDARDLAQRRAGIYHWTPDVVDYNDPRQQHDFQMSGLDDLNTENPMVRQALRRSYGHWIKEVGVDAFRVDTAFYAPPEYFADFLYAKDSRAPGIVELARRTGRAQFHVFGEGFAIDKPFGDEQARRIERYMTGPDGKALLPGMLNFPLYGTLGDVFARGRPTAELGHRIHSMMSLHARPHLMPSFVDNHDVDRFLAGGREAGLKQALLAMMTLPGIPVIYYGTEQGFTLQRPAMFAAGWASGGRDHYDTGTPLYRFIARATRLRADHRLFSRGTPTVLKDNPAQPGAIAWRMAHDGQAALVVMNSAETETLLDNLATGLPPGSKLQGLFGIDGAAPADVTVGDGGLLSMKLPARAGLVWQVGPAAASSSPPKAATITLDPLPASRFADDFEVGGSARGVASLKVVVDGDLANAKTVIPAADGRWSARVDTSRLVEPGIRHAITAWSESTATASATTHFEVARAWTLQVDQRDPAGDDYGPSGHYLYPTDPGWGAHRQMDLRRVRAWTAGGALRLDLTMAGLTRSWNPANGFDHVAFTIFLQLPGREGGSREMPLQDSELPAGMRWHMRLRAHGWSNALFSSDGASASHEGTPLTPAATLSVDRASHTVSLMLPAAALGRLPSLSGLKVWVTTWDYDGGYRALKPDATSHTMGGGKSGDPKVMDSSEVIVLP